MTFTTSLKADRFGLHWSNREACSRWSHPVLSPSCQSPGAAAEYCGTHPLQQGNSLCPVGARLQHTPGHRWDLHAVLNWHHLLSIFLSQNVPSVVRETCQDSFLHLGSFLLIWQHVKYCLTQGNVGMLFLITCCSILKPYHLPFTYCLCLSASHEANPVFVTP